MWGAEIHGNPIFVVMAKLSRLKKAIKTWAKERADVSNLLKVTQRELDEVNKILQCDALNEQAIEREKDLMK